MHVTETCDEDKPHLITHVETTKPNRLDNMLVTSIHQALKKKELLPNEHLVDAGYMDGELLVDSQRDYGVTLYGPVPANNTWQGKTEGAYTTDDFSIEWEAEQVTCPQGKQSTWWYQGLDKRNGNPLVFVKFAKDDCSACQQRQCCTRAASRPRSLAFKPKEKQQALQKARQAQQTSEWQAAYQKRAGVEGTLSQGVRAFGMRRSRYLASTKDRRNFFR